MKLDPYFTKYTKNNSEWIEDLKVRPESVKLGESIGENLHNIRFGNDFLAMTPKVQAAKAKIDKWD